MQRNESNNKKNGASKSSIGHGDSVTGSYHETGSDELSFIYEWLEDQTFAPKTGGVTESMSTVADVNTHWYDTWDPTQQNIENKSVKNTELQSMKPSEELDFPASSKGVAQCKQDAKREKNRKSAKDSRVRKKQEEIKTKKKFQDLSKEHNKLEDEIANLRIKLHGLEIVKNSIIHQESCGEFSDVRIHTNNIVSVLPAKVVENVTDNVSDTFGCKKFCRDDKSVVNADSQQVLLMNHHQQDKNIQLANFSTVKSGNNYVQLQSHTDNCTSFQPLSILSNVSNYSLCNQPSDIIQVPMNKNTNNDELSEVAIDNSNLEHSTINVHATTASSNQNAISLTKISSHSVWCVESNQEIDMEIQQLRDFFNEIAQ